MSASTFESLGSPAQKRPRPEIEARSDPADPEGALGGSEADQIAPDVDFRAKKLRPFTALNSQDECAVGDGGGDARRHFACSSHHYATAAVTHSHPTDSELLNNGDSGFQELNIPNYSPSLDVNENVNDHVLSSVPDSPNQLPGERRPVDGDGTDEKEHADEERGGGGGEDEEVFDDDDSISELSCASDISNISGADWKPISNHIKWVQMQMDKGASPKDIVRQMTGEELPDEVDDMAALRFIVRLLSESTVNRPKLSHINTLQDVISLIQTSSKIIVLTGAGVSVSCGIPDFRSRNGIYARLSIDYPDLPDPQSMFDIHYFKRNPYPFFKFAKEIYPGQFSPSPSHKFIRCIEQKGKLLRNYSQNIDTLEQTAGIERVITCHGSFSTASCTNCGYKVDSNAIKSDIFAQRIPLCLKCSNENATDSSIMSVMKPDIVFFGEGLSDEFHNSMTLDKDECDLLIVIGSSLKVRPVALIPNSIPETIPQILINREPLGHLNFDVELLGDCDIIIKYLCERLGPDWTKSCFSTSHKEARETTTEITEEEEENEIVCEFSSPNRYIFKGAEINRATRLEEDPDEDDDQNDQSDQIDEDSDSENNDNNLNTSEESVSQVSTIAESSASSAASIYLLNKSFDDTDEDSASLQYHENGHDKLSLLPTHSTPDSIHPSEKKRESIENYSPNSF